MVEISSHSKPAVAAYISCRLYVQLPVFTLCLNSRTLSALFGRNHLVKLGVESSPDRPDQNPIIKMRSSPDTALIRRISLSPI